ncbi:MAG: SGNH/GDSL hydrolase family protein, partial [Planctomycetota bacterium]
TCNDAEPQKNVPGHPSMRYAGFGSWGIGLARYFVSSTFSNRERKTEADETFPHDYDFHYPNSFEPGCRKAGACRSALESMARFCREQGIGFICFMMPDFTTKFDADYPYFTIHEKVRHWCQESDILCIDLLPRFIGLDNMALNVPSDGHPSSEGHLLLAEAMFEAVDFHFPGLKRKE